MKVALFVLVVLVIVAAALENANEDVCPEFETRTCSKDGSCLATTQDDSQCSNAFIAIMIPGCGDNGVCWPGYGCQNDHCTDVTVGKTCSSNYTCSAFDTTGAPKDDYRHQACLSGTCGIVPIANLSMPHGTPCSKNYQCASKVCTAGYCVGRSLGANCTARECGPGLYCNGTCKNTVAFDGSCSGSDKYQCKYPSSCIAGVCKKMGSVPAGGECIADGADVCQRGLFCLKKDGETKYTCQEWEDYATVCESSTDCPKGALCGCYYGPNGKSDGLRCWSMASAWFESDECSTCQEEKCGYLESDKGGISGSRGCVYNQCKSSYYPGIHEYTCKLYNDWQRHFHALDHDCFLALLKWVDTVFEGTEACKDTSAASSVGSLVALLLIVAAVL